MDKEELVQELVENIERTYREKIERYGEFQLSLFEWSHLYRCVLSNKYGISGDVSRILIVEAWNRTHPHKPYRIPPTTLDNPELTFENI